MQVRVITLEKTSSLINIAKSMFPQADVDIQRGINVQESPTHLLFSSDLITHSVVHTLQHGRKWHHEIPSKGAIGLAHATRLAVEEDTSRPLLLLEADCNITRRLKMKREVAQLLSHSEKFDIAVFGAKYDGTFESAEWFPPGFTFIKDKFWLLHSVLYTPSGRKKVSTLLRKPLEMQIDSLYGAEAQMGNLRIVGQVNDQSTKQYLHLSTIQEPLDRTKGILFAISVLVLYLAWRIYKGSRIN